MNAFGNKEYVDKNNSNNATSYEVKGDMGVEWRSIGAEKSVIGKPIANEVCDWTQGRVNCYQNFENGAISWTPSTARTIRLEQYARNGLVAIMSTASWDIRSKREKVVE